MDKEKILEYLDESGMSDIEVVKEEKDYMAVKFYYDFDSDELKAAEAYANDEAGKEKDDSWFDEFYLPYLTELAVDNVGEIVEEVMGDTGTKAQFVSYQIEEDDDFSEFIAIFHEQDAVFSIDDILESLED